MAGDWIKFEKSTLMKPEVLRVASILNIHRYQAVGACLAFWSWCDDQLRECHARSVTEKMIDDVVGVTGFAAALLETGWLLSRNGSIEVPNFDRHLSDSAKNRSLSSNRQRRRRNDDVAKLSRSERDKSVTREEKRREEEENTLSASPDAGGKLPPAKRGKTPKPPPKPRERDPLFDAIAEVTGLDSKESGPLIGMVKADLAGRDPPFSAEDVRQFARDFWKHCPHAIQTNRQRPTANEVKKYISLIRAAPPPPQQPPSGPNGRTKGEAMDNYAAKLLSGINERQAERVNFSGLPPAEDYG